MNEEAMARLGGGGGLLRPKKVIIEYVIKFLSFYGWNVVAYPKTNAQFQDFAE